jgi:hypothetical protein
MVFPGRATALHPQIVVLLVDDSDGMQGDKSRIASETVQDCIITIQAWSMPPRRPRHLVSIATLGARTIPIAVAQHPNQVNLLGLVFDGASGNANFAAGLVWAKAALEESLRVCRAQPDYQEEESPGPLVALITAGAILGDDVNSPARDLGAVPFSGEPVKIVVCGLGLEPNDLSAAPAIASGPVMGTNIRPGELTELFACVRMT